MRKVGFITRLIICLLSFYFLSCNSKTVDSKLLSDANLLHNNQNQLTEVIIYDVFSPPVASRIYAYTSLAAYEALRFQDSSKPSFTASMHGFPPMPRPEENKEYNYLLAATKAYFTVAAKVTFSIDTLKKYEAKVYDDFKSLLEEETYNNSISFGESVGKKILERTTIDNYKETRGMAKFLGSNEPGQWRPTPPDYLDGAEPHWWQITPLVMDSCTQFKCIPPPPYSTDTVSKFYKSVNEVYAITTKLTDEQKEIAKYWDDNPFVIEHSGHLMFGNKKITPVGHWMGIAAIACKIKNADPLKTAEAYALTSTAIFDALIACWKTKYTYYHIRPITVINEFIDPAWQPFLQTPPFPEHVSGHSGISAAGAAMLTKLFGDFSFEDTSDLKYIGMKRTFPSFTQAAEEASISRVYGGIHYRAGVDAGAIQGKEIAEFISSKLIGK